jgi:hypothetical protein
LGSAAAGDAAAELRGAREDVRQLLKATSCHPILVGSSFSSCRGSLRLEQTSDSTVGSRLFIISSNDPEFMHLYKVSLMSRATEELILRSLL